MCECLKRPDGTWHVDECCAWVMDDYHNGVAGNEEIKILRARVKELEDKHALICTGYCELQDDGYCELQDEVIVRTDERDALALRVKELEQIEELYQEQTADARRMSTKLDRISEVMDE